MTGVKKIIAGGIITVILCQMLVSCQQPSKISYNKPYDLTRLDFTMDVPYFMSGSIILKEFITDDENYRDDVSGIGRDTEMYHFCHWVDEKLSDTQHYIDENDNFIIDEATYQRWGILYEQSGHISKSLATFHSINFETFNVVTDLNHQLEGVGVSGSNVSLDDIKQALFYCNENYEHIDIKDRECRWEFDDLVFVMIVENNNTFRFSRPINDKDNIIILRQFSANDKVHANVYFFIYRKNIEKILKNIKFGIFGKL